MSCLWDKSNICGVHDWWYICNIYLSILLKSLWTVWEVHADYQREVLQLQRCNWSPERTKNSSTSGLCGNLMEIAAVNVLMCVLDYIIPFVLLSSSYLSHPYAWWLSPALGAVDWASGAPRRRSVLAAELPFPFVRLPAEAGGGGHGGPDRWPASRQRLRLPPREWDAASAARAMSPSLLQSSLPPCLFSSAHPKFRRVESHRYQTASHSFFCLRHCGWCGCSSLSLSRDDQGRHCFCSLCIHFLLLFFISFYFQMNATLHFMSTLWAVPVKEAQSH